MYPYMGRNYNSDTTQDILNHSSTPNPTFILIYYMPGVHLVSLLRFCQRLNIVRYITSMEYEASLEKHFLVTVGSVDMLITEIMVVICSLHNANKSGVQVITEWSMKKYGFGQGKNVV